MTETEGALEGAGRWSLGDYLWHRLPCKFGLKL